MKRLFGEGDLGFGRRGQQQVEGDEGGGKAVPQTRGSVGERAVKDFFARERRA